MIKYSQQIGRDGDLKPVPIAEKTAKNLNGVASHPIIFRVLLWQIKLVLKHEVNLLGHKRPSFLLQRCSLPKRSILRTAEAVGSTGVIGSGGSRPTIFRYIRPIHRIDTVLCLPL